MDTRVFAIVFGQTVSTASRRPLSPLQTSIRTSFTPRFLVSVRTRSQFLAPSPPHRSRISPSALGGDGQGHMDGPVGHDSVAGSSRGWR